ncbi:MAG: hypothetical protein K2X03_31435 [Bryobacteraceae bacterium]|nr:hypothetical protein [Bryobacteraceae bacterium]
MTSTLPLQGDELRPRLAGDALKVSSANLRLLTGRPLESLKNGATVTFDFQVTALNDARYVLARTAERFVFSYDLWQERFSVVQLTARDTRQPSAAAANLLPDAAEQWCMERLALSASTLDRTRPLRLRLEIRADEPRRGRPEEPPVSLATLIDLFSRPARREQRLWVLETLPFRLDSLK